MRPPPRGARLPPMLYGAAGYAVAAAPRRARREVERITEVGSGRAYHSYQDWLATTELEAAGEPGGLLRSNRGLRRGWSAPRAGGERLIALDAAGLDWCSCSSRRSSRRWSASRKR